MTKSQWTVAEAKAKFSEIIDRAKESGPQVVTRNGKRAAVVVSTDEWDRRTKRKTSLVEFFLSSPLRGANLQIPPRKGRLRKVDL
jgi:prevent-host-death family protein